MDVLDCMAVFAELGKTLSFSRTADNLGASKSSVTKKIAWLEAHFEVQLLNRNTKHVSLTEGGRLLLDNADTLERTLSELKELVRGPVRNPSGRLRIGAPPSFGAVHLVPAVAAFLSRYPAIRASLLVDDGRSDLIAENIDMSVRIAPRLKDTNQIAYRITVVPQVLVATRAYLGRHGTPSTLEDLCRHNCLVHNLKAPTGIWTFIDAQQETQTIRVGGTMNSNLGEAILHMAKLGHGISMHPRYMVENDLRDNRLEVLLPDYEPQGLDIYAIVQSKKHLPHKLRLFVEHLREWFKETDWR